MTHNAWVPGALGMVLLAISMPSPAATQGADTGLLQGATVDLTGLNYYYNRDFRSGVGQGKREEWAQGFILDARSGWTPGPIGFGVDLMGLADVKLDGVSSEEGTGILPTDANGARNELTRLGITGKARAGESVLRIGTLIPNEPIIKASTSRMLPQTFQGGILESKDIPGLDVYVARYTSSWYRDGVGNQPLTLTNKNRRFSGTPDSDHFDMLSAQYQLGKQLVLRYQTGELDQIYRQQVLNLTHKIGLGAGVLRTEVRYFKTDDVDQARAGRIDSTMLNALVGYTLGGHELSAGLQNLSGRTAMPWLGGTDGNVFNWTFINDFLENRQHSWQARYALDGDKLGLKGWKFMARYIHADHADPATVSYEGREWERDFQLDYQFQSEGLKHFSVRWINGTFRSNFQRDADENRIILQYKVALYDPD
ncbi:OprD family porin [[Pseudomonas] boreopolis]|uniref:Porin n=1 Tax=Xanthomonas boreopolis TaxID=86183 RepID=A0A919KGY7_9XANT|nr:porin [[Pseudomonas] boreopolis]